MAQARSTPIAAAPAAADAPAIRTLAPSDLWRSLAAGWADFRAAPTQLFFLCALYPVAALVIGRVATGGHLLPLLYPLASGFALVGPLAAVGVYEISRRRERGQSAGWRHAFDVLREPGFASVAVLGLCLLVVFVLWLAAAQALAALLIGDARDDTAAHFASRVLGTPAGWGLVALGNLAGLAFAALVLATAAFSIPLALDRATPPLAAIRVSVTAVWRNARVMALWGVVVAVLLVAGALPALIGLAVVMPVLGHATWHLYRRAIG